LSKQIPYYFNIYINLAPNMKAETLICEKECADAEKADDLNAFNNCVDPFDPGHSVLKFCVELYPTKEEKWLANYC
jgi:hypothetical protein